VRWAVITNEPSKHTNEVKITEQITRRKWNWIGQTLRKENEVEKEAMEWKAQGQRQRERPRGDGREQHESKPWLLGRHGENLNKSARTV
jgi:hypothetical protein